MRIVLAALVVLASACAPWAQLTKQEADSVLGLAREKVLASGILKGQQEAELIQKTEPKLSYYFLSGAHYADYEVEWSAGDNDRIVVSGRGDILKLEGANVQRLPRSGT